MRFEIHKHWEKLKRISKLGEPELKMAYDKLLTKLTFINEELIPKKVWQKAEQAVTTIDLDDTDFVALSIYLKGSLWTGDKQLYDGLKLKRFRSVFNTHEMVKLRDRLTKH